MSAQTKLELLGLIDGAVRDGWAHTQACRVLDLADDRAHRWRARLRETGTLEDRDPGGGAVHGLLAWEEQAILDVSPVGRYPQSVTADSRFRCSAGCTRFCHCR